MGYDRKFSGDVAYTAQVGVFEYSKHELYSTWRMMNIRCYDDRHKAYHRYGGRGITVCDAWRWDNVSGFSNFLQDMFPRPEKTSLDRIDNSQGYSVENCRWVEKRIQQNNTTLTPKRDTGLVGVTEDGNTLRVILTLNGVGTTVGIFKKGQYLEADRRYKDAVAMKFTHTDDEIVAHFLNVDGSTPNGKRFYSGKTSKYYGVCWSESKKLWRAYVNYRIDKASTIRQKHVGYFDDEDYAYSRVLEALEWVDSQGYVRGKKGKNDE